MTNTVIKNCVVKTLIALLACAMLLTNSLCANASHVIIDHNGDSVEIPDKIDRIAFAGILPLPAMVTVFLCSAEKIVGIPPASMGAAKAGLLGELFPEILKAETNFTSGSNLNIEELMKLRPDIVFYIAGNKAMGVVIKNAGIPAIAISPAKWGYDAIKTYDEWINTLSQIFPENAKSKEISSYTKKVRLDIQERVKDIREEDRKNVLFLYQYDDRRILVPGARSYGQFWCNSVGAKNVSTDVPADGANGIVTMEQIYSWNPDVIFITNFTPSLPEDLYENRIGGHKWDNVKAVKDRKVYKLPLGTYRSYTTGVDAPLTLMWMAQKVYPELFKDIVIEKEVRDYYEKLYGITLTDDQITRMYNQGRSSAEGFIK